MRVNKNKYLVVGANSFLGSVLIKRLKIESEVTGVYHIGTERLTEEIKNIPISEMNELNDEYDAVFIISAFIPDKNSIEDLELLNDVNVGLPKMISNKFKNAKLVYASSVSVYPENSIVISEKSDLKSNSEYGKSKEAGEKI
ncbi:MAG: NAD(P)-dependent oxidoreductase, partial [Bacteroidetes bacterium]|nr:NAD(P)-dependent oxidoreductase [Bacteroidota bacterium]